MEYLYDTKLISFLLVLLPIRTLNAEAVQRVQSVGLENNTLINVVSVERS
jgi:hypothetical protein